MRMLVKDALALPQLDNLLPGEGLMYILLTEIGITETLGVWQNIFKIKQSSPIRTKVIIKRKKNRVSYLSFWYP